MAVTFLNRPQYLPLSTGYARVKPATRPSRAHARSQRRERVAVSFRWSDLESYVFAAGIVFGLAYVVHSAIDHTGPFATTPTVAHSITVRIAPGDTVWSLSGRYRDPAISSEERVEIVRSLNPSLDFSRPLPTGAKIVLPVAFSH